MASSTVKQVAVLRKDLKMRKGKCVAQGGHAYMGAVFQESFVRSEIVDGQEVRYKCIPLNAVNEHWFAAEFTKICLGCDSEAELLALTEQAKAAGLPFSLIQDAGHTEFHGVPTYTALGIGPAPVELIDKITGHLQPL